MLVTGGSGFIGTNVIEEFLRRGDDVCSIDIADPQIDAHRNVFRKIDIMDRPALERVFADRVTLADLEPALGRARHRTALARAREALGSALEQLGGAGDAVLTAHHVRQATTALDELVGAVDIEEVLDRVFASFCVGK